MPKKAYHSAAACGLRIYCFQGIIGENMYSDDDKIKVQAKEQNEYNLRRWREFRLTAEYIARALCEISQIHKDALTQYQNYGKGFFK